jgi:dihydrofolate reductase
MPAGLKSWISFNAWKKWARGHKAEGPQRLIGFDIVVAIDRANGIGNPWRIPSELRHFRRLTSNGNSAVIMGRRTWQSLPQKAKPLPNRINIIISRTMESVEGGTVCRSLDEALLHLGVLDRSQRIDNAYVIGGSQLYDAALNHVMCRHIYMTAIDALYNCDKRFPEVDSKRFIVLSESSESTYDDEPSYKLVTYVKKY